MRARAAFETSYEAILARLEALESEAEAGDTEECLRLFESLSRSSRRDLLSAQDLPLRAPELRAPLLDTSGAADTASLTARAEEPATPVIGSVPSSLQEVAESLAGPVAVYEYVKNNTTFELYFGLMKGAEQTYLEGRGNDADINALLVNLLRAKGIPARYVRGVIRLSSDQAMNLFGVESPERVEQVLDAAAVPYEPVLEGGGLAGVMKEHIWVEAYLPYSNYRGTSLDDQGKRWVPLDASFEFHTIQEGSRVLEAMDFDADAFLQGLFIDDPTADPLEELLLRVETYLETHEPGMTLDAAHRRAIPVPEVYGLLPASLPYEIVSAQGIYFDFPEDREHRIRILARNERGETLLDSSFSASRLLGRRLTLSYIPANLEDEQAVGAFGGIYRTPPFLIQVRPVFRSAGLVVATGQPIGMGMPLTLTMEFIAPAGDLRFENRMIAGAYAAVALSGRGPTFSETSEARAGEILSQRALNYLERWNQADDEIAGLTRVVNLRPVPSHVMVKNHVAVDYAAGSELVPLTFEWKGIDVDADLRPSAPVAVEEGEEARRQFFLLSGAVGSDLESRVLEDDLGVTSVSTLKLLRLANASGIDVVDIDGSNVDDLLALSVALDPDTEDSIRTHVHLGRLVTAPVSEIDFLAWTGDGFVSRDLATGESAYMLSGDIAGGSTAVPPEGFPPYLRDELTDPEESSEEPSRAAAFIAKVPDSDYQEGIVARELGRPLEVWVTDADGNAVADGVPVTFRTLEEESLLTTMTGAERGSEIRVPTEGGIARARFVLGKSTYVRRRYVREKPGDSYMTQVGTYSVSAAVDDVSLSEPFVTFAFPDAEEDEDGRHARMGLVSGRYAAGLPLVVSHSEPWVVTYDQMKIQSRTSKSPSKWKSLSDSGEGLFRPSTRMPRFCYKAKSKNETQQRCLREPVAL